LIDDPASICEKYLSAAIGKKQSLLRDECEFFRKFGPLDIWDNIIFSYLYNSERIHFLEENSAPYEVVESVENMLKRHGLKGEDYFEVLDNDKLLELGFHGCTNYFLDVAGRIIHKHGYTLLYFNTPERLYFGVVSSDYFSSSKDILRKRFNITDHFVSIR